MRFTNQLTYLLYELSVTMWRAKTNEMLFGYTSRFAPQKKVLNFIMAGNFGWNMRIC